MSTVVSALLVVCALTASGVLLVQLAVSESRRSRQRAGLDRTPSAPQTLHVRAVQPERQALPVRTVPLPERTVPPRPIPPVRPVPVRPAPIQPVVWPPTLSPDGAWLWTGSGWVPAWWGGTTVPPPPPFAVTAPPRPARSHGCAAAFGVGCAVVLGVIALVALAVLAAASALASLAAG